MITHKNAIAMLSGLVYLVQKVFYILTFFGAFLLVVCYLLLVTYIYNHV